MCTHRISLSCLFSGHKTSAVLSLDLLPLMLVAHDNHMITLTVLGSTILLPPPSLPPSLPVSDCLPTLPEVGQQIIIKFWEVWECMAHKLVAFLFSTTPEAPMVDILQVGTKYIHTLHQVVKAFFSFVGCHFLHHPSSHAYHISF